MPSRFEAAPHPDLRPFVESYWGFARGAAQFAVTPDSYVEVIFFLDAPFVLTHEGRRRLPRCALIPLLAEPLHLGWDAELRCAAVRFNAWAAGALVLPDALRAQPWRDASAYFPDALPLVVSALRRGAWVEIPPIFDAMLIGMKPSPEADSAVGAAKAFLELPVDGAAARTDEVASGQGRSRRQIERRVRSLTNRSPKQLTSLRRFQAARDALWAKPDVDLSTVAVEAGYADQAHLTREFKRYSAQTPGAFRLACERLRLRLLAEDVAFVQGDAGELGYAEGP